MFHHWPHSPLHDKPINIWEVIAALERLSPQPEDKDFYNPFTEEEPESAEEILCRIRALNEPLLPVIPSAEITPGPYDIYGIWGDHDKMDVSKDADFSQDTPLTSEDSFEKRSLAFKDQKKKKKLKRSKKGSVLDPPRRVLKSRGANTKYRDGVSYRTQRTLRPTQENSSRVRKNRHP